MTSVPFLQLDANLEPPRYAKPGDAGADLSAAIDITLEPGQRALVPTGVAIALPDDHVGLIHPRSGLALRHGLSIVNAPGTIDSGYRGEIKVLLINLDPHEAIEIHQGDRIAQLIIQRFETVEFVPVAHLEESERGEGGYGSSGGHKSIENVRGQG